MSRATTDSEDAARDPRVAIARLSERGYADEAQMMRKLLIARLFRSTGLKKRAARSRRSYLRARAF